jgi:hypothetical protein
VCLLRRCCYRWHLTIFWQFCCQLRLRHICHHPCRLLAELLIRLVQATAVGLTIQPLTGQEMAMAPERLIPPMTTGNYELNSSACWLDVSNAHHMLTVAWLLLVNVSRRQGSGEVSCVSL